MNPEYIKEERKLRRRMYRYKAAVWFWILAAVGCALVVAWYIVTLINFIMTP